MSRQYYPSTPDHDHLELAGQLYEPAQPAYISPPHAISAPIPDPDAHAPIPPSTSATTDSNGGSKVPVNSFMYFRSHAVDTLCEKGMHHALFAIARDIWNEKTAEEKQWWKDRLEDAKARCLLETGRSLVGQVSLYRVAGLDQAKIALPGRMEELYSWYISHPPPIKPRTKGKKSVKKRPERSSLRSGDRVPSDAQRAARRRRRPIALRGAQNDSESSRSGSPSSVSTGQSTLGNNLAQAEVPAFYAPQPATQSPPMLFAATRDPVFPAEHGQSHPEPSIQAYPSAEVFPSLHAHNEVMSIDELGRLNLDDTSMSCLYGPYASRQMIPAREESLLYTAAYQTDYLYPVEGAIDPYQNPQLLETLQAQDYLALEAYLRHAQDSYYKQAYAHAGDGACDVSGTIGIPDLYEPSRLSSVIFSTYQCGTFDAIDLRHDPACHPSFDATMNGTSSWNGSFVTARL